MAEIDGLPGAMTGSATVESCLPPRLRKGRFNGFEAHEYLQEVHGIPVAPATLAKWRSVGGGPKFQKFGRAVLYPRSELDAWAIAKLSKPLANTSEA